MNRQFLRGRLASRVMLRHGKCRPLMMSLPATPVKSFLAFLLFFSLALRGPALDLVAGGEPHGATGDGCVPAGASCTCCQSGHCACAEDCPQSPVPSAPAPAPRPVSAGDPVWVRLCGDFSLQAPGNCFSVERAPARPPAVRIHESAVPLYRWHCAMLW